MFAGNCLEIRNKLSLAKDSYVSLEDQINSSRIGNSYRILRKFSLWRALGKNYVFCRSSYRNFLQLSLFCRFSQVLFILAHVIARCCYASVSHEFLYFYDIDVFTDQARGKCSSEIVRGGTPLEIIGFRDQLFNDSCDRGRIERNIQVKSLPIIDSPEDKTGIDFFFI